MRGDSDIFWVLLLFLRRDSMNRIIKKSKTSRFLALATSFIMAMASIFIPVNIGSPQTVSAAMSSSYFYDQLVQPNEWPTTFDGRSFLQIMYPAVDASGLTGRLDIPKYDNTTTNKQYMEWAIKNYIRYSLCGRAIDTISFSYGYWSSGKIHHIQWTCTTHHAVYSNKTLMQIHDSEMRQIVEDRDSRGLNSSQYKINPGDSEFTKIHKIHDFATTSLNHVGNAQGILDSMGSYDDGYYSTSECLKHGNGVCWDMQMIFKFCCDYYNIPCENVIALRGVGNMPNNNGSLSHAWNLVQYNGTWYVVDPTKDRNGHYESGGYCTHTHGCFLASYAYYVTSDKAYLSGSDIFYDPRGNAYSNYYSTTYGLRLDYWFIFDTRLSGFQAPNCSYNYPTSYLDYQVH